MLAQRLALLCVLGLMGSQPRAAAQGWGTVQGRAVCTDARALQPKQLKVTRDRKVCLKEGLIFSEEYVVNPKNKGVRWVVAWLAKDNNGKAEHDAVLPVHPDLKALKVKEVVMEVRCCRFEPHVVALRKGQDFTGRNLSAVQHNMNIQGRKGPAISPVLLPSDKEWRYPARVWKPDYIPRSVSCNIHPWMQAKAFCFAHPYFAVTDADGNFEIKYAPAGKYRLIVWHEGMGWVAGDTKPSKHGKLIEIKPGGVTNVGKLAVTYNN